MQKTTVSTLAECALLLAVAVALSFITVFHMPYGGSVTLCSMVPLLYVAFRYPLRWTCLTALAHGLLQMLFSFYPPPARTLFAFTGVVLLDYAAAFGVLGLAGLFARPFKGTRGMLIGGSAALAVRFLCHFLSGIIIWGVYAPEGQAVWLYSLLYNGSFMLGEWLLSMAAILALAKVLPKHLRLRP
ncbi:MAG: energy-coupled thiamine transporter ThiT [Firmicutes bacterium]|nr:energy-coupled thiamine transporter ThiT [Bacillota bacterium]